MSAAAEWRERSIPALHIDDFGNDQAHFPYNGMRLPPLAKQPARHSEHRSRRELCKMPN
jgi:hypothetical protein